METARRYALTPSNGGFLRRETVTPCEAPRTHLNTPPRQATLPLTFNLLPSEASLIYLARTKLNSKSILLMNRQWATAGLVLEAALLGKCSALR